MSAVVEVSQSVMSPSERNTCTDRKGIRWDGGMGGGGGSENGVGGGGG